MEDRQDDDPGRTEWLVLDEHQKPFAHGQGPDELLEVRQLAAVEGGGYYPVDYRLEQYTDIKAPEALAAQARDREGQIRGKYRKYQNKDVREETTWKVLKVEAGWKSTPGMFDMPFPENTIVADRLVTKPR